MTEIQMAHFAFGGESPDRSRFHEVAMRDARATTDRHAATPAQAGRTSLVSRLGLGSRLRVALAGGPATTEACNCPA